ncbi:MAG: hypothetical protein CMI52_00595 [Parcubacteria group bacterium]|nr:hypothetical protein [Parcubacteria group bacterium]
MNHKKAIIFLAVVWIAIIGGFVAMKEYTIQTGEEVLLKTIPVDPRDLFRGDYVILSYEISRFESDILLDFEPGDKVYVKLDTSGYYAQIASIHSEPPEGLYIAGTLKHAFGDNAMGVEYGIESYFIPENKGYIIERAQRNSENDVAVTVAVGNSGKSVIKELLINGEEVSFDEPEK